MGCAINGSSGIGGRRASREEDAGASGTEAWSLNPVIDAMLLADLDAPRKQRHTAQRVFDRLVDEHHAIISYSSVRQYVKARRVSIAGESGSSPVEALVPQEHAPGAEAEVDFGDVWVDLDGIRTRCYMFAFRLSHSGKPVHRIYPTCAQEALLEGHIEAFNAIGGVPVRRIRYDNLGVDEGRLWCWSATRGERALGAVQIALWVRCPLLRTRNRWRS